MQNKILQQTKIPITIPYIHSVNIYKHNNITLELTLLPCAQTENFLAVYHQKQLQISNYEWFELLIFLLMGSFGGLAGALFNEINIQLSLFRLR